MPFQKTHGMRDTVEYGIWAGMHNRCKNPNVKSFPLYGGRGIKVCERWESFENFYADMGARPSSIHTLDRRDGNRDYEPSNCRWATHQQQQNNRRNNVVLQFMGETMTQQQWARRLGVDHKLICQRLDRGWSIEKTLSTPPRPILRRK